MQLTVSLQMKVMVMKNICTHAGIANGSRGTIAGIMLDERELELHTSTDQGRILLVFPPAMLLFKPTVSVMPQVHGILEGLIPMFPDLGSFTIHMSTRTKVQQRQFALTLAYAFTDFKSQGQMIECVIVDLGKTSSFRLDPFHAYVSLSRSRGRETIRLLRDFDHKLLTHHPSDDLQKEDERFVALAEQTKSSHLCRVS
jgi:ATP-dependent exoDNAse (exonuclease V) alpha subunit